MDLVSQATFDQVVKLDPESLNVEQKEFLNARKTYLTQEQRRVFASVLVDDQEKELTNNELIAILKERNVELPKQINKENLLKAVEDSEPEE